MADKFQIGFDYMVVKVDDITSNVASVLDDYGKRHDIRTDIRRGNGPYPRVGEIWLVDRTLGAWTFAASLATLPPVIDLPADGVTAQLLSALDSMGLIQWGTSSATFGANEDYADSVPLSGADLGGGLASFSIASANIKWRMTRQQAESDVQKVLDHGADIIAFQEMGRVSRHALLQDIAGYGQHLPSGESDSLPIIWRSSMFNLIDKGEVKVVNREYVGPAGAGLVVAKSRYVVWVKLLHVPSGKTIIIGNNHAVASCEARGHYRTEPEYQNRVDMHKDHMVGMRDFVSNRTAEGLVFLTGDLNFNFRTDSVVRNPAGPFARMNSVGMEASFRKVRPEGGTHGGGGRLIDYVMYERNKPVAVREQRIIRGLNTDHHPLLVSFDLTDVAEPA